MQVIGFRGRFLISFFLSMLLLSAAVWSRCEAQEVSEIRLPVMITSCGQSPDAFILKVMCDRIKVKVSYRNLLTANDLKEFKTLMVVMGGSAKGLGEAGIDEREELERIQGVLAKAKAEKMQIIGVHLGGEARRGPLSDGFIKAAAPQCDSLIVMEDGNKDGYFTKISQDKKKLPLTLFKDTNKMKDALKNAFKVP
jgi:hypothetical protein